MRRNWLTSLLLALAVFGLVWGTRAGALWDPHEVSMAELSRRIAVNLLGGAELSLPGADNSVPIRAELGRGELPFTSAALGFRLLGLHDWAGRLPLALWSLVGLGALYLAVARLWERRAALHAVLVLSTMPLYFLQARTLLGDAVTLAAFAMAWSGLAVALLAREQSLGARVGFAVLGALGLYAGFWCRGAIVSVAVPALAVGGTAVLFRPAPGRLPLGLSIGAVLLGLAALTQGLLALASQRGAGVYSPWVGGVVAAPGELPSFDVPLSVLVHACFPWSVAAPLALALPWTAPERATSEVELAPAAAAVLALGGSLAAAAWLSPTLGVGLAPGAVCLAVLVAGALRELERGPLALAPLALMVAALAVVIGFDLRVYPDKALAGFGLGGVELPEALQPRASKLWTFSALGLAAAALFCLYDHDHDQDSARARRFDRAEYGRVLGTLQRVWDGNLVFALLVLEAALVGFLLLSAISERVVALPQLETFGSFWRKSVALAAIAVPLVPLLPLAAMLLRDLARSFFDASWLGARRELAPTRAQGLLLAGASIGLVTSLGFYPALARQVAPKEVFERYRELQQPGEPLGTLGQQENRARYQSGPGSVVLPDSAQAFAWLTENAEAGRRRWLLIRKADLAELNALSREQHFGNVPILDARSSEVLLASNRRARGERDESPLAGLVLDRAPPPQHPVVAVLGERKLEVLGWSLLSEAGELAVSLTPTTRYRFVIYLRVLGGLRGNWRAFVHIEGLQRRFNADHELLEGKYPLELWREGDVMADATDVVLEPNFSPGSYAVYFGLFDGDRRLEVTEGPEVDDRIVAGTLQIR